MLKDHDQHSDQAGEPDDESPEYDYFSDTGENVYTILMNDGKISFEVQVGTQDFS